jgi:hypothetical protein
MSISRGPSRRRGRRPSSRSSWRAKACRLSGGSTVRPPTTVFRKSGWAIGETGSVR